MALFQLRFLRVRLGDNQLDLLQHGLLELRPLGLFIFPLLASAGFLLFPFCSPLGFPLFALCPNPGFCACGFLPEPLLTRLLHHLEPLLVLLAVSAGLLPNLLCDDSLYVHHCM